MIMEISSFCYEIQPQAELGAITHGLILCRDRGLIQTVVEIDSTIVFNMIMRKSTEAWQYKNTQATADGLAKWAYDTDVFKDYNELPS